MSTDTTGNSTPSLAPDDLIAEGVRARRLSSDIEGVKTLVEGTRLVNDWILAHVLRALWDSGIYEYSLTHSLFSAQQAADELHLDPATLKWMLEYLVGRGIMRAVGEEMGLTDYGTRLSNVLIRGTLNLYVAGWGPLLANVDKLLRKEISQSDFNKLRSGRHTVGGTEQLICVRTAPAVLKVLVKHQLRGIVNLACRTGQFLVELARSEPTIHGIGVDRSADHIAAAEENARRFGLSDRLKFIAAEVGRDRINLDESTGKIDVVIALFLLHEVARHGKQKVIELLKEIKQMCPGRHFLFTENLPGSAMPEGKKPPTTFTQLDYLLIHRIRNQGLPLPTSQWKSMLDEAGIEVLEVQELFWSVIFLTKL